MCFCVYACVLVENLCVCSGGGSVRAARIETESCRLSAQQQTGRPVCEGGEGVCSGRGTVPEGPGGGADHREQVRTPSMQRTIYMMPYNEIYNVYIMYNDLDTVTEKFMACKILGLTFDQGNLFECKCRRERAQFNFTRVIQSSNLFVFHV